VDWAPSVQLVLLASSELLDFRAVLVVLDYLAQLDLLDQLETLDLLVPPEAQDQQVLTEIRAQPVHLAFLAHKELRAVMDQQGPRDLRVRPEIRDSLVWLGLSERLDNLEALETQDLRELQVQLEIPDNRVLLDRLEQLAGEERPDRPGRTDLPVHSVLRDRWDNKEVVAHLELAVRRACPGLQVQRELTERRVRTDCRAPLAWRALPVHLARLELPDSLEQLERPGHQDHLVAQERLGRTVHRAGRVQLECLVLLAVQERRVPQGL